MTRAEYIAKVLIIARDAKQSEEYAEFAVLYGFPDEGELYNACIDVLENPPEKDDPWWDSMNPHPFGVPVVRKLKENLQKVPNGEIS